MLLCELVIAVVIAIVYVQRERWERLHALQPNVPRRSAWRAASIAFVVLFPLALVADMRWRMADEWGEVVYGLFSVSPLPVALVSGAVAFFLSHLRLALFRVIGRGTRKET